MLLIRWKGPKPINLSGRYKRAELNCLFCWYIKHAAESCVLLPHSTHFCEKACVSHPFSVSRFSLALLSNSSLLYLELTLSGFIRQGRISQRKEVGD